MSSGDIKGTVSDGTGAALPGAAITATNVETGIERRATTDALGSFRFFVLLPGVYELRIQAPGFFVYTRRPVQVAVGQTASIDAVLQPASTQQEILVQGELPLIETEKTQQADTITREQIENLPINERDFLNFALLTPGNTSSVRLDHSLSASNQMFARLGFTDIDTAGGITGGLKAPSRGVNFSVQDSAAVFGDSRFRFEGIFETFNLFNRVNFSGVNNVVGSMPLPDHHVRPNRGAGSAEPLGFTSAFDPRQIQVGLKFKF